MGLTAMASLIGASPASAACIAPSIAVSPSAGAPGTSVTVVGENWRVGCNDTVTQPVGGTPSPQPPEPPDTVTVIFTQNGQSQEVGTVTANSDYTFTTRVRVPSSAVPGEAAFTAKGRSGQTVAPVPFQVTAGATAPGGQTAPVADTLPRTGSFSDVLLLAVAGLGMLAAGGWLGAVARPRGRHAA